MRGKTGVESTRTFLPSAGSPTVTSVRLSIAEPNDQVIRCMAAEALERIIVASTPKLLFWDAKGRRLRAISAMSGSAKKMIGLPSCLGTYDFNTKLQDIIDDLNAVFEAYSAGSEGDDQGTISG